MLGGDMRDDIRAPLGAVRAERAGHSRETTTLGMLFTHVAIQGADFGEFLAAAHTSGLLFLLLWRGLCHFFGI